MASVPDQPPEPKPDPKPGDDKPKPPEVPGG
jgi:hypothetical protein